MRRVIVWNLVTIDGHFEGRHAWELDWHEAVWGDELERLGIEQVGAAGALLFGRVTYEGMARHWPTAKGETADLMNATPKVVFSRTLRTAEWSNARVAADAAAEVARLKAEPGGDLLIFGSAKLIGSLAAEGLIDEYRLCLTPIVLGGGRPMFEQDGRRMRLELLEARPLANGGLIVRYAPAAA